MAPVVETMYWLPYCSTCVKADQYLQEKGIEVQQHVDMKADRLPMETIEKLVAGIGGAEALFSKRAMKYRSLGLDKRDLTPQEMLGYMHEEYTFIKRPVLVLSNGKVLAGFSKKQYDTLSDS
jgi:arsenate reductase